MTQIQIESKLNELYINAKEIRFDEMRYPTEFFNEGGSVNDIKGVRTNYENLLEELEFEHGVVNDELNFMFAEIEEWVKDFGG